MALIVLAALGAVLVAVGVGWYAPGVGVAVLGAEMVAAAYAALYVRAKEGGE